jgi:hypothetical protein
MFFYKLLNFFYNDRILGQAGRKIGESVGSISRGPTPGWNGKKGRTPYHTSVPLRHHLAGQKCGQLAQRFLLLALSPLNPDSPRGSENKLCYAVYLIQITA